MNQQNYCYQNPLQGKNTHLYFPLWLCHKLSVLLKCSISNLPYFHLHIFLYNYFLYKSGFQCKWLVLRFYMLQKKLHNCLRDYNLESLYCKYQFVFQQKLLHLLGLLSLLSVEMELKLLSVYMIAL